MTKHTFKILWCEHLKILKVYLAIFQHLWNKGLSLVGSSPHFPSFWNSFLKTCDIYYVQKWIYFFRRHLRENMVKSAFILEICLISLYIDHHTKPSNEIFIEALLKRTNLTLHTMKWHHFLRKCGEHIKNLQLVFRNVHSKK